MPEDQALSELQALDAVASEDGVVLAFRVCEETDAVEPVFIKFFRANADEDNETALVSIEDQRGLSLGRYVVGRERLEQALEGAEDVEAEEPEPTVVPPDWGRD